MNPNPTLQVQEWRKEAERALAPFAKWASGFGPYGREDSWVIAKTPSGKTLTMGDVRFAHEVHSRLAASLQPGEPSLPQSGRRAPLDGTNGRKEMTPDMFKPDLRLLVKLGSIVVHAKEVLSPDGHAFDRVALQSLMDDPEVKKWLKDMDAAAMLPKMRKTP